MLESLAKKLFSEKKVKRAKDYSPLIAQINDLEPKMRNLSEDKLRRVTDRLKERLQRGESLDALLPEAFAAVRRAAEWCLGMRHFDVQVEGGIIMHSGAILEMKTGEGKTLAATLPVYLNALEGKGVHVHTINEYLAKRDFEWMAPIYRFLGLSVGHVSQGMAENERRAAYACDITYAKDNEIVFDFLRDQMKTHPNAVVQRGLHFALIDEVDLVLIDEARTPLTLTQTAQGSIDKYRWAEQVVSQLQPQHYQLDEGKKVLFTEAGIQRAQEMLQLQDLFDPAHYELYQVLNTSLRAHHLYKREVEYLVENQQVVLIEEHSGRKIPGRRYSEGLHQALEAKEGVPIRRETETVATITFQNFFRQYAKLSGMSATADVESAEFHDVFGLDVQVLPTHHPMIRRDLSDQVYGTKKEKYHALLKEVIEQHQKGRPVLIGTLDIESSEFVGQILAGREIPHVILNAKFNEMEADIVALAGRVGAVTITTQMSGRGTDIILGGNPEIMAKMEFRNNMEADLMQLTQKYQQQCAEEKKRVIKLGGLFIVGTERNEERRKDEHLIGRAGRQGDPGTSMFVISLEDKLMHFFMNPRMKNILTNNMDEGLPIKNKMVDKAILRAQTSIAKSHYETRKNLLQYDNVLDKHRHIFYKERQAVLNDPRKVIFNLLETMIDHLQQIHRPSEQGALARAQFFEEMATHLKVEMGDASEDLNWQTLPTQIYKLAIDHYLAKWKKLNIPTGQATDHERFLISSIMDRNWKLHLANLANLKSSILLEQGDPLLAYQHAAIGLFEQFQRTMNEEIVGTMMGLEIRYRPRS